MKIGFDNEKYLKMQSEHIRDRINQFDNKLYLEFGGKPRGSARGSAESCSTISTHPAFFRALHRMPNCAC